MDRGAEDEVALRNNREAFERIKLRQSNLVDVSRRSQEITLFGKKHRSPIAIAPMGVVDLMWYQGTVELARAAAEAGIPFILSTDATSSMEAIAEQASGANLWFQLYLWSDPALLQYMIERAQAAGYEALVVTVDGTAKYEREYNIRNGFSMPFRLTRRNVADVLTHPRWLAGVLARYALSGGMPQRENYPAEMRSSITARAAKRMPVSDTATWEHLRELRKRWRQPLLVKGIMNSEDAVRAADCGADGVIISNHGARHLDSGMATIDVLPEVVDAVGKRIPVIVDGGFRRGSDVVKALAIGASGVLIGRAALYGTAVGGRTGAARAIALFRDEIDRVLGQMGCPRVADLNREHLVLPPAWKALA